MLKRGRQFAFGTFYGTSTAICEMEPFIFSESGQYLLACGNFSGKMINYGNIQSNLSTYEFTVCEPRNFAFSPPEYDLEGSGVLYVGKRGAHINVDLVGAIWLQPTGSKFEFAGKAAFSSGTGTLSELNGLEVSVRNIVETSSLVTGVMNLRISASDLIWSYQ